MLVKPNGYYIKKMSLIASAIVFVVFCLYYLLLLYRHTNSDIQAHAKIAYSYAVNKDKLFPNFLYFFLVAVCAGFSKNVYMYYAASVFLISLALTAKFIITDRYFKKYTNTPYTGTLTSFLPAIAMLFVFALPGINFFQVGAWYLGQLPPNVWHNSTVIFLMPFTVLLFFKTYGLLFGPGEKKNGMYWQVFFLVVLNALVKPSFLFTLIPSVFLFFFCLKFFSRYTFGYALLLPFIAGILFIGAEYYLIYHKAHISNVVDAKTASSVGIEPLVVWKYYAPNILLAFIGSCFFPLVYLFASKGKVMRNRMVQFAWVNYAIGLCIWILLAEEGFRKFDANFIWQVIATSYLLFFALWIQFINDCRSNNLSKTQRNIIGGAFWLHFVWGVVYWIKIIIFIDYV